MEKVKEKEVKKYFNISITLIKKGGLICYQKSE